MNLPHHRKVLNALFNSAALVIYLLIFSVGARCAVEILYFGGVW